LINFHFKSSNIAYAKTFLNDLRKIKKIFGNNNLKVEVQVSDLKELTLIYMFYAQMSSA